MTNTDKRGPVKICLVAPKAYPIFNPDKGNYFGGAEVDLYYLATELAKDIDFEVSFIVADYGQPLTETREGVTIIKTVDFKKTRLLGIWNVWRGLRMADAHIYLLKTASPGTPLVALFCKVYSRLFTYRTASIEECDGTYLKQHFFLGRAFVWSLRQAKVIFAQNANDRDSLQHSTGLSSVLIPNGHRLPKLNHTQRDTILWVGRDADVKKPRCFLELARAIPSQHFTIICQTLTNDQDYNDMIAEAAQIKNLQFIPHVPFNQVDSFFRRAKVLVNTSDSEGFPNTFIHACLCETPILSLNVNPDGFLDKYSCGICCEGNEKQLPDTLKSMLAEDRYIRMGRNGRKYAEEKHDIKKIAEQYKELFFKLVQGKV